MSEIKLTIHPFEMDSLKEAAKKVQEEAGEAFAEYVILQEQQDRSTTRLADEIADVIQAACNLAVRYGINLQAAMERCERRNRWRGRYEDTKSCGACGGNDCDCGGGGGVVPDGDDAPKSPDEMSADELIEALKATTSGFEHESRCKIILGDDWCKEFYYCFSCRNRLLDLLKAAYEREVASLEYEKSYYKEKTEAYERDYDDAMRRITDIAHERDGLRRRLAELSDAGITELHRLLRETVGEAKNITDNARVYINKKQESKDEHCGSRGSDRRDHGVDCGAERVGEHLLPAEPPTQEISEREAVIERLRGIEFDGDNVTLSNICVAVMGRDPSLGAWWNETTRRELRDKLIELLSTPGWDYCKTCELVKSDDGE